MRFGDSRTGCRNGKRDTLRLNARGKDNTQTGTQQTDQSFASINCKQPPSSRRGNRVKCLFPGGRKDQGSWAVPSGAWADGSAHGRKGSKQTRRVMAWRAAGVLSVGVWWAGSLGWLGRPPIGWVLGLQRASTGECAL